MASLAEHCLKLIECKKYAIYAEKCDDWVSFPYDAKAVLGDGMDVMGKVYNMDVVFTKSMLVEKEKKATPKSDMNLLVTNNVQEIVNTVGKQTEHSVGANVGGGGASIAGSLTVTNAIETTKKAKFDVTKIW